MKKQSITLLATIFFAMATVTSFGQSSSGHIKGHKKMEVKYLNGDNEFLLFNVKYEHPVQVRFYLTVLDENSEVLFRDNFKGKHFEKEFKIPRLSESSKITFIIKPVQKDVQLSYDVSIPTRVNDEALASQQ